MFLSDRPSDSIPNSSAFLPFHKGLIQFLQYVCCDRTWQLAAKWKDCVKRMLDITFFASAPPSHNTLVSSSSSKTSISQTDGFYTTSCAKTKNWLVQFQQSYIIQLIIPIVVFMNDHLRSILHKAFLVGYTKDTNLGHEKFFLAWLFDFKVVFSKLNFPVVWWSCPTKTMGSSQNPFVLNECSTTNVIVEVSDTQRCLMGKFHRLSILRSVDSVYFNVRRRCASHQFGFKWQFTFRFGFRGNHTYLRMPNDSISMLQCKQQFSLCQLTFKTILLD